MRLVALGYPAAVHVRRARFSVQVQQDEKEEDSELSWLL